MSKKPHQKSPDIPGWILILAIIIAPLIPFIKLITVIIELIEDNYWMYF